MSETFKPGQLVEWVSDAGIVNCRARIVRKSEETFVSYDDILPCWDLAQLDGRKIGPIADKNIRSVRLDA